MSLNIVFLLFCLQPSSWLKEIICLQSQTDKILVFTIDSGKPHLLLFAMNCNYYFDWQERNLIVV